MDIILALCIGLGLSAACGFRVFVPLFVMSLSAVTGIFSPAQGFEWLVSPAVCMALGLATCSEILAYYIPWVDNLLDTIATPAAVVAGTVTTMAVVSGEMSQFAAWAAAIIVGGGTASAVQLSTVAVRGASTATTGGLGNFIVSTAEWMGAVMLSVLAMFVPIIVVIAVAVFIILSIRWVKQKRAQQHIAS